MIVSRPCSPSSLLVRGCRCNSVPVDSGVWRENRCAGSLHRLFTGSFSQARGKRDGVAAA